MRILRALKTNYITQKFGENKNPIYGKFGMLGHNGIDWRAKDGEKVYFDVVSGDGLVLETHIDKAGGLGIIARTGSRPYYKHRYWHLKKFAVKPGDKLSAGDLIGWADNTGYSTGTHLHRDLKICGENGKTLNWTKDYRGAIDYSFFLENIFVKDYIDNLKGQRTILKKLIILFKTLIKLKK